MVDESGTGAVLENLSLPPEAAGTPAYPPPPRWWQRGTPRQRRLAVVAALALSLLLWFVPPVWMLKLSSVEVTRWDRKKGKTQALVGPKEKHWTPIKKISRHALSAIVVAEDGKFYQHHGIDWEATWEAARSNYRKKRYARGASTISQQVVKMAFLDREKSLIRKAREAVGTLLMELILSKEEILEWYINLAEFGDAVYSVAEGSRHYFHTKPELLTIEQSVHLALVLPSPNRWSNGLRRHSLTPFGHRRFAGILNGMRQSGYITKTQWASAITRGDFGRPIMGYTRLLAAEEEKKILCPGDPSCPEEPVDAEEAAAFDEEAEELTFPAPAGPNASVAPPAETLDLGTPAATPPSTSDVSSPGAVGIIDAHNAESAGPTTTSDATDASSPTAASTTSTPENQAPAPAQPTLKPIPDE